MKIWNIYFTKEILIKINKYKINWLKSPSKEQQILQDFLYPYWRAKIVLKEVYIPSSKMRLDIVCATNRIVIEYSPKSHHGTFNKFFHKNRQNYGRSIVRDSKKVDWILDPRNNLKYLELNEDDLPLLSVRYLEETYGINIL